MVESESACPFSGQLKFLFGNIFDCYGTLINFQMADVAREVFADRITPEQMPQFITDFAAYPDWNPFIRSIEGEALPQSKLKARLQPSGGRALAFNPTILNSRR